MPFTTAVDRREFVRSLCTLPFLVGPAQAEIANDIDLLKIFLLAEDGAVGLGQLSRAEMNMRIKAGLGVLAYSSANTPASGAQVQALARGEIKPTKRELINLSDRLSSGGSSLQAILSAAPDAANKLTGSINQSASAANSLFSAALVDGQQSIGSSSVNAYQLSRALTTMLAEATVKNQPYVSVIANPEIAQLLPIRPSDNLTALSARLPPHARSLMETVLNKGITALGTDPSAANQLLSSAIKGVFETAQQGHRKIAQEVQKGALNFHKGDTAKLLSGMQKDVGAVGALGAYILGNVLGDKKSAEQLERGMQVANIALSIGMMFATGGVGIMAGAGSVLSGLSSLGSTGGGGGMGAAIEAMSSQLSNQIATLRKEMHERFDRLEELHFKTLRMLDDIAREIKEGTLTLANKMDIISAEIVQLDNYVKNADRHRLITHFNELASNARIAISDQQRFGPAFSLPVLAGLLRYSIDDASHPAFTSSEPAGDWHAAVAKITRSDLAVGLLSRSVDVLNIPGPQKQLPNPIEWARGVNGYLEAHASLPDIDHEEIRKLAKDALSTGQALQSQFKSLCSGPNLMAAEMLYRDRATLLAQGIRDNINKKVTPDGWTIIGAPWKLPKRSEAYGFGLSDLGGLPRHYDKIYKSKRIPGPDWKYSTASTVSELLMTDVDIDLFVLAVNLGRVTLKPTFQKVFSLSTPQANGKAVFTFDVGTETTVSVIGRRGGEFQATRIDLMPIGGLKAAPIWKFKDEGELFDLFRRMQEQLADEPELSAWLKRDETITEGLEVKQFEEAAASLILLSSMVGWRVTDLSDTPWNGTIAMLVPRSTREICDFLRRLSVGVSRDDLNIISGAELDDVRSYFEQRPDQHFQTWAAANKRINFGDLAYQSLLLWTGRAKPAIRVLSEQFDEEISIATVDRTVARLNTFIAQVS